MPASRAGLVAIQKQVERAGSTHTQTFWVRPEDAKSAMRAVARIQQVQERREARAGAAPDGRQKRLPLGPAGEARSAERDDEDEEVARLDLAESRFKAVRGDMFRDEEARFLDTLRDAEQGAPGTLERLDGILSTVEGRGDLREYVVERAGELDREWLASHGEADRVGRLTRQVEAGDARSRDAAHELYDLTTRLRAEAEAEAEFQSEDEDGEGDEDDDGPYMGRRRGLDGIDFEPSARIDRVRLPDPTREVALEMDIHPSVTGLAGMMPPDDDDDPEGHEKAREQHKAVSAQLTRLFGRPMTLAEVTHAFVPPEGFSVEYKDVDVSRTSFSVTFALYHEASGRLAVETCQRTFNRMPDGTFDVHHDYLVVDREFAQWYQEETGETPGISAALNGSAITRYREAGWPVSQVTVQAAWDGRYQWAKSGFYFDEPDAVAEQWARWARDNLEFDDDPDGEKVEAAVRLGAEYCNEPWKLAALDIEGMRFKVQYESTGDEDEAHAGKAFLLSRRGASSWYGTLQLDSRNPGFEQYLRQNKVLKKLKDKGLA